MAVDEATFHSNESAAYVLPNDASEQERLEKQSHAVVAMMKGQPFTAPIIGAPSLRKALDIGCGTGAMTIRLGRDHPHAKVYGVDLTPVPGIHESPNNVEFVTGEIRELVRDGRRGFEQGSYSYIFSRMLIFGMTGWPGYYVDFVFRDRSGNPISQDWRWFNAMNESVATQGLDTGCAGKFERMMKAAGLVDVEVRQYVWSWSTEHWEEHPESDEIGRYSVHVLRTDVQRTAQRMYEGIGKSEDEVKELFEELGEKTRALPKATHMKYSAVCGRRPR